MADRRELSNDTQAGIKTDFIFEAGDRPSGDKITIATSQDVTKIVEANRRARNEIDKHKPHGEWSKVASIPLSVLYDLKRRGIADDPSAMKRWLNDPDNRAFRTRDARI
tara:strand:+ start:468 stop:794 length:327 start_codon:yes stop_codon:yes gene_type:complete